MTECARIRTGSANAAVSRHALNTGKALITALTLLSLSCFQYSIPSTETIRVDLDKGEIRYRLSGYQLIHPDSLCPAVYEFRQALKHGSGDTGAAIVDSISVTEYFNYFWTNDSGMVHEWVISLKSLRQDTVLQWKDMIPQLEKFFRGLFISREELVLTCSFGFLGQDEKFDSLLATASIMSDQPQFNTWRNRLIAVALTTRRFRISIQYDPEKICPDCKPHNLKLLREELEI